MKKVKVFKFEVTNFTYTADENEMKQARDLMPDKDKAVHDNVQSICNEISRASQRGMVYYCTPLIVCVEETMDKLRQLGYAVSINSMILTVSWRGNE